MNMDRDCSGVPAIDRPDHALWTYYLWRCLLIPPLFPVLVLPYYFRYHTMRYRFDGEGISMRWGILFRREIIVNYARIQDIHLHSNIIERWLGLARILIQTASGSGTAEMTIEGIKDFEALRDFLYSRMRGVGQKHPRIDSASEPLFADRRAPDSAELSAIAAVLRETTSELKAIRQEFTAGPARTDERSRHV